MKLLIKPKTTTAGKNIPGRFVAMIVRKPYVPKLLRGSIELPSEQTRRAKAEAKRQRKNARRVEEAAV